MQPFLIKSSTHCRLLQTGHFQPPSSARAKTDSGIELAKEVPGTPRAHSTARFGGVGEGQKATFSSFLLSVLWLIMLPTLGAGPWLNSTSCPVPFPLGPPDFSPAHAMTSAKGRTAGSDPAS